ncbi:MAG TPA: tRNA 2-thiouridine(34) synthase MnmA [Thermomicrobiales bacterium]|nr:tRNA 2-thiouridine(34) synthase MnmA [Thermomicrobiales bacterium]
MTTKRRVISLTLAPPPRLPELAAMAAAEPACPLSLAPDPLPRLHPDEARALLSRYDVGPVDGNGRLVVVAISGGVDSAVTALVLRERGYQVVGMNMRLYNPPDDRGHVNPCCSIEAMEDARASCRRIDIPFYALNMAREFEDTVIHTFVSEYASGRTPNPCLECNRQVKFKHLINRARMLGAEHLATGHYARIEQDAAGVYHLYRALDESKDQSYVLHTLSQAQLAYLLFPLGRLHKTEVRELARAFGLSVADKAESQDICFVGKGSYAEFVRRRRPELTEPGPIVDVRGRRLGEHRGLLHYTVGQRKGLGIAGPEPLFVVRLEAAENRLVVGTRVDMSFTRLDASGVSLTSDGWPAGRFDCSVVVRYRGTPHAATIEPLEPGRARVHFADPPFAVAPGQAVVFYSGDEVLGGGTITASSQSDGPVATATAA